MEFSGLNNGRIENFWSPKSRKRANSASWIEFLNSEKYDIINNIRNEFANFIDRTECKEYPLYYNTPHITLYLKCEYRQFSGSYRARGAFAMMKKISKKEIEKGVTVAAIGDEGLAFCYSAEKLNILTKVSMPATTPLWLKSMHNGTKFCSTSFDAVDKSFKEVDKCSSKVARSKNMVHIKKCENTFINAYGTIGLEIIEQLPDVDVVVLPNVDKLLIQGILQIVKSYDECIKVVVVNIKEDISEMSNTKITSDKDAALECDMVDESIQVLKSWVDDTIQTIYSHNIIVDRESASTIAAFRNNCFDKFRDKTVVLLLTGGNIDVSEVPKILQQQSISSNCLLAFTIQVQKLEDIKKLCEFLINEMEVCIKEISHERIWHTSDILVKVICEVKNEEQYELYAKVLNSQYQSVNILPCSLPHDTHVVPLDVVKQPQTSAANVLNNTPDKEEKSNRNSKGYYDTDDDDDVPSDKSFSSESLSEGSDYFYDDPEECLDKVDT